MHDKSEDKIKSGKSKSNAVTFKCRISEDKYKTKNEFDNHKIDVKNIQLCPCYTAEDDISLQSETEDGLNLD